MNEIKRFEDLKVWQKSHELVLEVLYKITRQFPKAEKVGLISQIGRMLNGLIKSLSNRKREEVKV